MRNQIALLLFAGVLTGSCIQGVDEDFHIVGNAQGTTFSIRYYGESAEDYSDDVASILTDFDKSLSLWRDDSFISKINRSNDSIVQIPGNDEFFIPVIEASSRIHRQTNGAFDPSIYPLVRAWGFGAIPPDSDSIPNVDSLLSRHSIGTWGMNVAAIGPDKALMKPVYTELDFNGIAQGYSVDVLGEFLESKGVKNYMVEIGGELIAKGIKKDGSLWTIGIDKPTDGEREMIETMELKDAAVATSGSYRKYKERNGKRYSHCIDPRTGYPVDHTLLSVTVVAPTCIEADAYATGFMVMGVEKTLSRLEKGLGSKIEVLMIYDDGGENKMIGTGRFK